MSFLLLTGVPRSGTTLAAALLDKLEDTVCLSEPDEHVGLMKQSRDAADFVASLFRSMKEAKRRLVAGDAVLDRRGPDGAAVTNYFGTSGDGPRPASFAVRPVDARNLSPDMFLAAKHNALYAAVLPELVEYGGFRIVALVRDPVPVIRSWRSLTLPVSRGRLPAAERYWPEMRLLTASDMPLLNKQIMIFDLICRRFIENAAGIALLRYEDMLEDSARLAVAAGRPLSPRVREEWLTTVNRPSQSADADVDLREAIRAVCARGEAKSLLTFYPQYDRD